MTKQPFALLAWLKRRNGIDFTHKKNCVKSLIQPLLLPRTQACSSGFESDCDFGSALGIMGKVKRKTFHFSRSPFSASFASMLNVPMVHCAMLLDGSCSRIFRFPYLRRLGTKQAHGHFWGQIRWFWGRKKKKKCFPRSLTIFIFRNTCVYTYNRRI